MSDQNPLDPLTDGLIETAIAFTSGSKKVIATKTVVAYWRTTLAGPKNFLTALALLTGGEAISQEIPVRKPDEHISSQSQPTDTALEGRRLLEAAMTSGSALSIKAWDVLQTSEGVVYVPNSRTVPPDSSSSEK
jgi:hypothetical protein